MSGVRMLSLRAALTFLILLSATLVVSNPQSIGNESQSGHEDNLTVDWSNQKSTAIRAFFSPTPAEYQKAIDEETGILRARVILGDSTTVEFNEKPKDIDFYDSTIEVKRHGAARHIYNVGEMIKHQALSLAHVGIVPSGDSAGMLVCEYEGGAVGAREGFAILRFSPSGFELHTLPLTNFGKVVVFRGNSERAEVWSALPYPVGSDADPMFYTTQACRLQSEGYRCSPPKRHSGSFGPAAIDDPGIEVRP